MDTDISFTGLTSSLRKTIYKRKNIEKLITAYPESDGFVGSLIPEWLDKISKEQRQEALREISSKFSEAIGQRNNRIFGQKTEDTIREVLCKYGIITPETKVKFSSMGVSDMAELYKLQVGEKQYVTKIFPKISGIYTESGGNLVEQNHALYMNAGKKTNWAKFHFGNLKDGYMITDYIKDRKKAAESVIDIGKIGLEYTDKRVYNIARHQNSNYGGLKVIDGYPIGDKTAVKTINDLNRLSADEQAKKIVEIRQNSSCNLSKLKGADYVEKNLNSKKEGRNLNRLEKILMYILLK